MSKNKKVTLAKTKKVDFEREIMGKIASGQITMKPRWYFILGSLMMILGLISSTVIATFLINLTAFVLRKKGFGYGKLDMVLANFPIWIPIVAVLGIGLGIFFLRKYDFSYRKNFLVIVIGFIISLFIAGLAIDKLGLNDIWSQRGGMRRFYQNLEGRENLPEGFERMGSQSGRWSRVLPGAK